MWRPETEIIADLQSSQPQRIVAGLRDLETRLDDMDEFRLPLFGEEILAPFEENVPEEVQLRLLKILANYPEFVPPPTFQQRCAAMIKLVLTYANYAVAYRTALELKSDNDPAGAIKLAVAEIARQGLMSNTQIQAAYDLVSSLLDGNSRVRQATLEALEQWPDEPVYRQIRDDLT